MVRIEFLKKTDDFVQYRFYPECKDDDFGVVQVTLKDFVRTLVRDTDKKYMSWYKRHAWKLVEKYARKNEFPEIAEAIWY